MNADLDADIIELPYHFLKVEDSTRILVTIIVVSKILINFFLKDAGNVKGDELNSKLLSIYNGSEVTVDGISVNQKWRQVRSDAAEKFVKKNKALAKKIFRHPASSGEKQRLYGILNSSVEASSNLALSKYRLKTKEYKNGGEKRALRKDIKTTKRLINQNGKDINWVIKTVLTNTPHRNRLYVVCVCDDPHPPTSEGQSSQLAPVLMPDTTLHVFIL